MTDLTRRIERLEERLGAAECVCQQGAAAVAIVAIESDWPLERIRQAEANAMVACPTHGRVTRPVLRLTGSDVHG